MFTASWCTVQPGDQHSIADRQRKSELIGTIFSIQAKKFNDMPISGADRVLGTEAC